MQDNARVPNITTTASLLPLAGWLAMMVMIWLGLHCQEQRQLWTILGIIAGLIVVFVCSAISSKLLSMRIAAPLARLTDACIQSSPASVRVSGAAGEIADIDGEFKRLSRLLLDVRAREQNILDRSFDGLLTLDENLEIKSANAAVVGLFADKPSLEKISLATLIATDQVENVRAFFRAAKNHGQPASCELLVAAGASPHVPVSISVQWSQKNRLFSCVLNDIAHRAKEQQLRAQNEKQLHSILEQMPEGILIVNSSLKIETINRSAAQLLAKSFDETVGADLFAVLRIAQGSKIDVRKLVAAPTLINYKRLDETAYLRMTLHKTVYAGAPSYIVVLNDVSYQQRLEQLRNGLLETITDCIGAPLTTISNVVRRIHREISGTSSNTKHLNHLKSAELELERMVALFSEFLRVEQSNVSQLSIQHREVSVAELFERTCAAVGIAATRARVNILADPIDARLFADSERIVQVLVNLVFNALKYTPPGGSIWLKAACTDGNTIEFGVIDSGRGIPAGMEAKIFEPFKQTSAEDTVKRGGAGLGLFICKTIVEKHGGSIAARNHEGGAVFAFRLPIDDLRARRVLEYEQQRLNGWRTPVPEPATELAGALAATDAASGIPAGLYELLANDSTEDFASGILSRPSYAADFGAAFIHPSSVREPFHGDPAKMPLASVTIERSQRDYGKFAMPALVAVFCVALYVVPAVCWHVDTSNGATLRQRQLDELADTALDSVAKRQVPMQLPAGTTGPISAPSGSSANDDNVEATELAARHASADPSDKAEFDLAHSRAGLSRLQQLIYEYMAKGKFARARDLAVAALRCPGATAEEKKMFWDLYTQCAAKCRQSS